MLENEKKQDELLETTDSLEAIGAFRVMKNFLFVVAIICLGLLQASFWLVETDLVRQETGPKVCPSEVSVPAGQPVAEPAAKAAQEVTGQLKDQAESGTQEQQTLTETKSRWNFHVKFTSLAWLIRLCNVVLILSAMLYCLTVLFALKISLVGRLGGINHISRAFFLSLFMLVFLLPWQKLFGGVIAGAIYTPAELARASQPDAEQAQIVRAAVYYLRFVVLWVITLLLFISAQVRTGRWSKATLRRLEVM